MSPATSILMYNRLSTAGAHDVEGDYAIPTSLFERHMRRLAQLRIPVIPLTGLGEAPPGASVVLTFDDGCDTDATVLAELRDAGMLIGSHDPDHELLDGLDAPALERQLGESRRLLQERLHTPVEALSLPGGSGGRRAVEVAHRVGYSWVLGSRPGLARRGEAMPLPRFAIRSGCGESAFEALVSQRLRPRVRLALRWKLTRLLRAVLGPRGWAALRERWVSRKGRAA